MPLYEYQCDACGQRFEVIQKFSDAPAASCTVCGKGPVHRLLSSPAIQFKGSGWYVTDYAQKGKSESSGASAATSDKSGKGEKTESTSESKTEAKSDTKSTSTTPAATSTPASTPKT